MEQNRKAGENITIPKKTTKQESEKQSRKFRKEKELERKIESRQECDSRHASISHLGPFSQSG